MNSLEKSPVSLIEYYETNIGNDGFHFIGRADGSSALQIEHTCRLLDGEKFPQLYFNTDQFIVTGVAEGKPIRSIVLELIHRSFNNNDTLSCKIIPLYTWPVAFAAFDEYNISFALSLLCGINPRTYLRERVADARRRNAGSFATSANIAVLLDYTATDLNSRKRNHHKLLNALETKFAGKFRKAMIGLMLSSSNGWGHNESDRFMPGLIMINERADYKLLDYARELLTRVTTLTAKRAAQRAMLNIIVQTLGTLHMLAYECGVNFTHHDIHRDNLMLTERSRVAGGKRLTLWYRMQHKGETLYAESAPIAVDGAGSSAKVEFLVPIVKLIDFGMASYDYYDKLGRRFTSGTATRDYGANARFVNNAQEMREHSPLHDIIRLGLALFDIAAQLHFDAREQTPEQTAFIADIATHACYMIPFVSVTTKSARFKDANAETLYGRLATAALAHSWPECFELFRDARNADVLRVACVELITPRAKEHFSTVSLFELFTNVLRYAKDTPTTVAGTRVVEASELHIVQFSQAANVTVA